MIEDILATLAAEGFVVSNTFQLSDGRAPGWQVYLRNDHNTRTGMGAGATLEAALRAAHAAANIGGTYVALGGGAPRAPLPPRPRVILGDPDGEEDQGELF